MSSDVPIEKWVEEIIRRTVAEHIATCPYGQRVQRMEMKWSALIGFMCGSGTLGGFAGAILSRLIGA
jgi:hypothetical protein